MLKNKRYNTQKEWEDAFKRCTDFISKREIDRKINTAVQRLDRILENRNPVCCWSGGKDAQVIRHIYERAGFDNFTMGCGGELEYPEFLRWAMFNKPANTTVYTFKPDYEYLNDHEELIFPASSRYDYFYSTHINQAAWYNYCKEFGADAIVLGHRQLDGNQCGADGVSTRNGILKVSPIYDFTHEEVFAAIRYYNMPMAPIYQWEDGYREGTHVVIARGGKEGKEKAMDAVMRIDPQILPRLAKNINVIRAYCESRGFV